jgi:Nif-specific regulatory protein
MLKEGLFSRIMEAVLGEIKADRSLVLVPGEDGRLRSFLSIGIDLEADGDDCRAVVAQVMKSGQPLMYRDDGSEPEFGVRSSSAGKRPSSILCLPLVSGEKAVGAVYLDRMSSGTPFAAGDLEFLAAAGGFLGHLLPGGISRPEAPAGIDLIGCDGAFRSVKALVEKVKNSTAPVFISGESGTGKELIARTIHETGARRAHKFVAVNCGAIPEPLLESELFGYARGAFTGAARDRPGLIEEADHGTFFLDEVGDLPLHLQAKLLRMLEERSIRRLGENRTRAVDVRFVSATNRDLDRAVREGGFREDLYYRLKIIAIELPPLRERQEDLLPLINHFTEKYARELKKPRPCFSPGALEILSRYSWPGNVRELQNEVQRCLIMAGDSVLIREDFLSPGIKPEEGSSRESQRGILAARAEFERKFVLEALARCEYSRTRTASDIGITRQGLFKLMKKHGIDSSVRPGCLPAPFGR